MEESLISVIMATKDTEEKILRMAIESILNQTYKNFEFIIISDGSEGNFEIINTYKDKRIIVIKNENSIGLTKSLNNALKIASGKYIARMDSDDISLKNRFKIQVAFLEKHIDVDICSTYAIIIGDKKGYKIDNFSSAKEKKAELLLYNKIIHPVVMIRTKFLKENNLFYDENYKYSQDYELWVRCSRITKIETIPKFCIKYRIHKLQISTSKIKEQNELCRKIYINNLKMFNVDNIDKKVDYLFFLTKKKDGNYSKEEISNFINEIIELNKKYKVYDEKSLKQIFYYRYFITKHSECNFIENTITLFRFNFIILSIKILYYSFIGNLFYKIGSEK